MAEQQRIPTAVHARAAGSPLPRTAPAAPGRDQAASHQSRQHEELSVAAVPTLVLLHRGRAPLLLLAFLIWRRTPMSPSHKPPTRAAKRAVISIDQAVLGQWKPLISDIPLRTWKGLFTFTAPLAAEKLQVLILRAPGPKGSSDLICPVYLFLIKFHQTYISSQKENIQVTTFVQ